MSSIQKKINPAQVCAQIFSFFLHFSPSKPISTKKASQGKTSRADFYVDGHLPRSPRRSRKCHSCLWPGLLISSCHFKYIWWLPCKIWLYLFQFSSLQTSLQAVNLDSRDPAVPLNYAVFLNKLGKVSIKKTMMSLGRVWHLRGTYYVYVCFLKNPPGFLAFEKSSSNLTSNRPFWLKQIYRDIKFVLKRLPGRCELLTDSCIEQNYTWLIICLKVCQRGISHRHNHAKQFSCLTSCWRHRERDLFQVITMSKYLLKI